MPITIDGAPIALARAQAQRGLDMLDREIGLPGTDPEQAAQIPAAGKARIERKRTVDQRDHGADILAEIRQHKGGVGEDARVVAAPLERPPSKIDAPCGGRAPDLRSSRRRRAASGRSPPRPVPARNADRVAIACSSNSSASNSPLFRYRKECAQARAGRDRRRSGRSSAGRPSGGFRPPAMPAR